MPIAVENPFALILLLGLPALYFVGRGRLSLMVPWRAAAILGVRLLSMTFIILALTNPSIPLNDASMSVAFALDNSTSASPAVRSQEMAWVQDAISQMRSSDKAGVVVFAGEAGIARPLSNDKNLRLQPVSELQQGSNISAALRLASGLLPSSGLRKVVLLSDGWDTAGQTAQAAQSLPAGTHLDVVPMNAMDGQPEALVESLQIPSYVRQGDGFDVSTVVESNHEGAAQLKMLVDGRQTGSWNVALGNGANLVTLSQKPLPMGFHSIEVQLAAQNDTVPDNNQAAGFIVVKSAGRVLLVQGRPDMSDNLGQELEGSGLLVERTQPAGFPIQLTQLLQYDAVVLNDVSGPSLSLDQVKTLDAYVREQGRGLLVVGGQNSFGLGNYIGSPLEDILPVSSNVPLSRERGDVALTLVVDRSGSMDESSAGVSKVAMAREAAIQATEALKPEDQLGIIAFDIDPNWIVPIQKVGNNIADIRSKISRLDASGGTDIYSALRAAYDAMLPVRATTKHIVLLTDGQSWKGPYQALLLRMQQAGITLSTLAIGDDADTQWLSELARLGNGRYYFTQRFTDIPEIVYREVSAATKVSQVQGEVSPFFVTPSPVLRGMNLQGMPTLDGYVATLPKSAATVVLRSERGDPLLSQWQYGLGRVVAWTSDAEGLWSASWISQPQYSRIWDQSVRWTMAPPIDRGLQLTTQSDGDRVTITADSVDHNGQFVELASTSAQLTYPDGSKTTVPLRQTGPGRYQATVTVTQQGLHRVDVVQTQQGQPARSEVTGFALPNNLELRGLGSNEALLKELASMTGGRALQNPAEAFSRDGMPSTPAWEPLWPYLLAASLLLLLLEVALRRIRSLPFVRRPEDEAEPSAPTHPQPADDQQQVAA